MKKKLLIAVLFTITLSLFAQSIPKASKLMVVNQKNENLSASEESWLPGAVRDRLEVNLQQYTDFLFVDSTNISAVKKIQKQSESAGYNESDAIELGKLTVAKYAVFLTLRKSGVGYTVVADVTNLTTGQKLASAMSSARKMADELFSTTGCAADELTIKLCEKLGITLSNTQKYALTHGDEILSNEDQLKMAQEEEVAFKNAIAKYDAEIKRLSQSTDLESTASKAKMEADKALAQEKLKASQERAKRLEEESKKAAADKAEDAARSEAQKQRRDQMAKEAAEKAATVRKATLDNESIFTKINVIESKKKAILDIQKSVDDRIAEIKKDGEDEFSKKKKEIMDAPYRAAEKNADGTPSATAKERREKQVKELRNEVDSSVAKECEEVKKTAVDTVVFLYADLKSDLASLSNEKMISSLENDLKVQIGTFDGKTNAWNVKYWLYSNGVPVTNGSVNLAYRDLTGKKIDTSSSSAYDEFMDTVDLYNSLFSRGDPVLTFKVNYKTESVDDYSSKYKITLLGCDVFDTVSNRKICALPVKASLTHQSKPVYNLRCELFNVLQEKVLIISDNINRDYLKNIAGKYSIFVIADGITSIRDCAFDGCESLESVIIPNSVTSIGVGAFRRCTSLRSVVIPSGVTSILDSTFGDCVSLKSIVIPNSVKTIGDNAFCGCNSLESVIIPDSVTSIGAFAFYRCTSLRSVVVPSGVTSIGRETFYGCISLKSVVIPSGVTLIGKSAFGNCQWLESVTIPDSVKTIDDSAFEGCVSLKSVILPSGVTSIETKTFFGCKSLESVKIPNSVKIIRNSAFSGCESLEGVIMPDSVKTIVDGAFSGCKSLRSVVLPNGVTSIGGSAFEGCVSLESVVISDSVSSIGDSAFYGCKSLKSVVIPSGVTSIGDNVFSDCESLESVIIPDSVRSIVAYTFGYCTSLKSITIKAKNPPVILNGRLYFYKDMPSNFVIYVPKKSVKAYQKADSWIDYAEYIKPIE